MQVSLTQEEKQEIHKANMCTWNLFNKIPSQYINFVFIYDQIIHCVDKTITYITNSNTLVTYDEYDELTDNKDDSFDYIQYNDIAKMVDDLTIEKSHNLRANTCGYINLCAFEYIQKHIINELKKTSIPNVLQKIMIEYVFE